MIMFLSRSQKIQRGKNRVTLVASCYLKVLLSLSWLEITTNSCYFRSNASFLLDMFLHLCSSSDTKWLTLLSIVSNCSFSDMLCSRLKNGGTFDFPKLRSPVRAGQAVNCSIPIARQFVGASLPLACVFYFVQLSKNNPHNFFIRHMLWFLWLPAATRRSWLLANSVFIHLSVSVTFISLICVIPTCFLFFFAVICLIFSSRSWHAQNKTNQINGL